MKIRYQLLLTHGLLVVLSMLIVIINVMTYKGMEGDALIVNQSGKLRALSYNMAQLSNRLNNKNYSIAIDLNNSLMSRIEEFENILSELRAPKSEKTAGISHNQSVVSLEKIDREWHETFRPLYVSILAGKSIDENCAKINSYIDSYVDDINKMVTVYSVYAREKAIKAIIINACLLLLIIIVAIYSFTSTNIHIRRPIKILMQGLKELSSADDDASKRIKEIRTDEISEMTGYFNEMMYDQLTKTFNRRSGLAKLSRMLQYNNRRHLTMSLNFVDINGLKEVNDQLGHKFGDELIVSVVEGIRKEIREEDFIIRMGGDEFLITFNGIGQEMSEKVWERINQGYQLINNQENRPYIISVSHGIVEYDSDEKTEAELLIKNADDKMYAEKKYIKEELKVKVIR